MANVVNFGVLPDQLAGLDQSIASGQDVALKRKQIHNDATQLKNQQIAQKNKYQVELARIEHQQDEEDYKHTQTTLKQLGMLKDQDPGKYALLMNSPHGKELLKHIKSVDPDSVDDDATNPADKLIVPGIKEQASQKLDEIKLQYANALKSGKPIDPHLKMAFDAINMHGQDDLSSAIAEAAKNPMSADPETFKKLVQNQLQMRKEFKAQQQQQGGQGGAGQAGQGNPVADATALQDPLGAFGNASSQ